MKNTDQQSKTLKPILFSTEMVRAILAGRKTQTRRIVKPQPDDREIKPKYNVFDTLWVRETSCYVMSDHAHDLLEGAPDKNPFVYKATVDSDWMEYAKEKYGYKWKPSIFMPFEACRLFLKIKSVRVERLQDISEEDAKAEGIYTIPGAVSGRTWYRKYIPDYDARVKGLFTESAKECFQTLWESINGKDSWAQNPFVWVLEFERTEHPPLYNLKINN